MGPLDNALKTFGQRNKTLISYMFNTAYCVIKEEMPFKRFPTLLQLQVKNDSQLVRLKSYQSDKACARFTPFIAEAIREPIQEKIQNCKVLSIMYDEATDSSVSEVEIVYCHLLENGYPTDYFIGLEDLEYAHADGVFGAIDKAMTKHGSEHWKEKLVGAGSDGASVNIWVNNSVATRLADGRPYVVNVHCVAHRLELAILSAIKENPMLTTVHDKFKKIHKHYHYSPKALRELKLIADSLEEKNIRPRNLQGTRWIPHIFKAIKALLSSYTVILAHFEHVSEGRATVEVKGRAKYLTTKLKDFRVLRFIYFMRDLLEIISELSLNFQKDGSTCIDFLGFLQTAYLKLIEIREKPGEHLEEFFGNLHIENQKCNFKDVELNYYNPSQDYTQFTVIIDTVIGKTNGRLENPNDNTKTVLQATLIFDTQNLPTDRHQLADYESVELQRLEDPFAQILDHIGCDRSQLKQEWVHVKAHIGNRIINGGERKFTPSINSL